MKSPRWPLWGALLLLVAALLTVLVFLAAEYEVGRDQAALEQDTLDVASDIRSNLLPGTPAHEVLINDALGDHQVTNYGAHVMARTMDIEHVDTGVRDIFGLTKVTAPHKGSGIVEYDFGLPPDPIENLPQRECEDPHGKVRRLVEFQQQLDTFYRTGTIENYCQDDVCSFPEMSGCP